MSESPASRPSQADKAARFRAMHESTQTFVIPNPWDVGTTRILTALGFRALTTTSAGLAFQLGRRDGAREVSRAETLEHVRAIAGATDLPVAADLEGGFGDDPETVAETIRLAAEAGAVGGSIEDASGDPAQPIYDRAHAVERITAAVEAARALPHPFVLVARAENFLYGRADLDDTLERLRAFSAAGADVLFAPGLPDLDAVRSVCTAVSPKPVNVLAGGRGTTYTIPELAVAGVRRISVGSALFRAGMGAFLRAAHEIVDTGTFTFQEEAAPFDELNRYMTREAEPRGGPGR